MKQERYVFDWALIVTFLIGLFLPLIFTNNRDMSTIEKRKLVPLPGFKWNKETLIKYPVQFQEFFNDHFGFRDNLAQAYYLLGVILGSSSSPKVTIGKNEWYYYINTEDGNSLEDYRNNDRLTSTQLSNWKCALEAKYVYSKDKGIDFLFVITPDKQSIYPEYFPGRFQKVGTQSRLDQFMEYMQDSDVPILDLRHPMLQAKPEGQLYFKMDTHWNSFGAAVAQYEIMQYLAKYYPNIHPIQYRAKEFSWNKKNSGDIANMLNLSDYLQEQFNPALYMFIPKCDGQLIEEKFENPDSSTFITNCHSSAPSVLIFRDSFFDALQPYIAQYFSKSVYVSTWPDMSTFEKRVEQYAPNIVIEQRVERGLKAVPAWPQPTTEGHRRQFPEQRQKRTLPVP
jgi:alginate O-acetyltransferase complex protein AlgJ